MPVMARYRTPAQGVGRWKVTAYETPVQVRGALTEWLTVSPGDILVGDADGVIAIPTRLVAQITPAVKKWSETETDARTEIAAGLPLLAALKKYGHL
jgi:regulator of RNase E activity RraA